MKPSSTGQEIKPGEYSYLPIEKVHFGPGSIAKLQSELDRLESKRPFVITGHTIATKTNLVDQIERASGQKLSGVFHEIKQHAPETGVRDAIKGARASKADLLISLGGGSPIDATKIVVKEISENFTRPLLPHVAVPTTLSAAEFSHSAGITDEKLNKKTGVRDPRMVPRLIFLDPDLTPDTPSWLWASTGIRSLDHAVESILSQKHQPYVDTLSLEAIRLLFRNLRESTARPTDVQTRLACQIAAWMSYSGALSVGTGISHAIGRVIGARWNIPHGITSCLTLAEVMRKKARTDPKRLRSIAEAEGKLTEGSQERVAMSAAEGVAELVRELGLSKRLRDYGIRKEDLERIADEVGSIDGSVDVPEILEAIW